MPSFLATILNAQVRNWLYGIAFTALALCVLYDVISAEALPYWLALTGAILGIGATGTAAVATKRQRDAGIPLDAPTD